MLDNEFDFNSYLLKDLDDYIYSNDVSDLEKAFFLILNQFPGDHRDYLVRPNEMILVPDIYDFRVPGIEYEIDFAIYGGSIKDPVKIAVECDGLDLMAKSKKEKIDERM